MLNGLINTGQLGTIGRSTYRRSSLQLSGTNPNIANSFAVKAENGDVVISNGSLRLGSTGPLLGLRTGGDIYMRGSLIMNQKDNLFTNMICFNQFSCIHAINANAMGWGSQSAVNGWFVGTTNGGFYWKKGLSYGWSNDNGVYGGIYGFISDSNYVVDLRLTTNPHTLRVFNTYTSSTSFENLQFKAVAASAYQIGSAVGSAGGTNRAIEIGHYSSGGTFTSALSIATSGAATFSGAITASNLSGTNTGDQDLSSYATTSAVAAGYVSLSGTNTITGLKTFRTDGGALSQTFQCYNPSTANGVQILNYKARGSLATPLYPAANDIILGHYCYGHDENAGAFSGVKASYICSIPDAWTATSNSTQWTWVTTDTLDATKTAANRMRLQSDGSLTVGGITQSGGLLELVKSNTGLTGFGTALNRMRFSDTDTTTAANQPIGEIEFYSYDATAPGAGVKGAFACIAESASPAAAFIWGLDAVAGSLTEQMRLSSVGLLTVVGGIKSTKGIYFTSEPTGTPSGTTQTLTLADGNHQTLALTSATGTVTATLTVPSGSSSGTIIVKQHASAAKDITWAVSSGTIKWMGTQPTWSSDAVSAVRLVSWRWDGSVMYLASTDVGT